MAKMILRDISKAKVKSTVPEFSNEQCPQEPLSGILEQLEALHYLLQELINGL